MASPLGVGGLRLSTAQLPLGALRTLSTTGYNTGKGDHNAGDVDDDGGEESSAKQKGAFSPVYPSNPDLANAPQSPSSRSMSGASNAPGSGFSFASTAAAARTGPSVFAGPHKPYLDLSLAPYTTTGSSDHLNTLTSSSTGSGSSVTGSTSGIIPPVVAMTAARVTTHGPPLAVAARLPRLSAAAAERLSFDTRALIAAYPPPVTTALYLEQSKYPEQAKCLEAAATTVPIAVAATGFTLAKNRNIHNNSVIENDGISFKTESNTYDRAGAVTSSNSAVKLAELVAVGTGRDLAQFAQLGGANAHTQTFARFPPSHLAATVTATATAAAAAAAAATTAMDDDGETPVATTTTATTTTLAGAFAAADSNIPRGPLPVRAPVPLSSIQFSPETDVNMTSSAAANAANGPTLGGNGALKSAIPVPTEASSSSSSSKSRGENDDDNAANSETGKRKSKKRGVSGSSGSLSTPGSYTSGGSSTQRVLPTVAHLQQLAGNKRVGANSMYGDDDSVFNSSTGGGEALLDGVTIAGPLEMLKAKARTATEALGHQGLRQLRTALRQRYPVWAASLKSGGAHLLLHGVGSKYHLVEEFAAAYLRDGPVVSVKGYSQEMTGKKLLNVIMNEALVTGPTNLAYMHVYDPPAFDRALPGLTSGVSVTTAAISGQNQAQMGGSKAAHTLLLTSPESLPPYISNHNSSSSTVSAGRGGALCVESDVTLIQPPFMASLSQSLSDKAVAQVGAHVDKALGLAFDCANSGNCEHDGYLELLPFEDNDLDNLDSQEIGGDTANNYSDVGSSALIVAPAPVPLDSSCVTYNARIDFLKKKTAAKKTKNANSSTNSTSGTPGKSPFSLASSSPAAAALAASNASSFAGSNSSFDSLSPAASRERRAKTAALTRIYELNDDLTGGSDALANSGIAGSGGASVASSSSGSLLNLDSYSALGNNITASAAAAAASNAANNAALAGQSSAAGVSVWGSEANVVFDKLSRVVDTVSNGDVHMRPEQNFSTDTDAETKSNVNTVVFSDVGGVTAGVPVVVIDPTTGTLSHHGTLPTYTSSKNSSNNGSCAGSGGNITLAQAVLASTVPTAAHNTHPLILCNNANAISSSSASASASQSSTGASASSIFSLAPDAAGAVAVSSAVASAKFTADSIRRLSQLLRIRNSLTERVCSISAALAAGAAAATQVAALSYDLARPRVVVQGAHARVEGACGFDDVRASLDATATALPPRLTVIVHSIDRLASDVVDVLALLAAVPTVRIIATAERPAVPLAADERTGHLFRWWCEHTPTFEPYVKELTTMAPVLTIPIKAQVKARLDIALTSLTTNHKAVLNILARAQVAAIEAGELDKAGSDGLTAAAPEKKRRGRPASTTALFRGLSFAVWLERAYAELVVNNEDAFRRYMRELIEQRLVVTKRDTETGRDLFSVPHPKDVVKREILGFQLGGGSSKTKTK